MSFEIDHIVDLSNNPINDCKFRSACKRELEDTGVLVIKQFLYPEITRALCQEGKQQKSLAYYLRGVLPLIKYRKTQRYAHCTTALILKRFLQPF